MNFRGERKHRESKAGNGNKQERRVRVSRELERTEMKEGNKKKLNYGRKKKKKTKAKEGRTIKEG